MSAGVALQHLGWCGREATLLAAGSVPPGRSLWGIRRTTSGPAWDRFQWVWCTFESSSSFAGSAQIGPSC